MLPAASYLVDSPPHFSLLSLLPAAEWVADPGHWPMAGNVTWVGLKPLYSDAQVYHVMGSVVGFITAPLLQKSELGGQKAKKGSANGNKSTLQLLFRF